jgi:hypothetical protein
LAGEPFVEWVPGDRRQQLGYQVRPARREVGVNPVAQRALPCGFHAGREHVAQRSRADVGQRWPVPQPKGPVRQFGGRAVIAERRPPPALAGQRLEEMPVDVLGATGQPVPTADPLDPQRAAGVVESPAHRRDVNLHRVARRRRRRLTPQIVNELLYPDHVADP